MQKIIRRSWAKYRNCQKQRFACKRRAKNIENSISLISETQKTQKTAFRLQATSEKHWKQHFAHKRNAENAKKTLVSVDETKKTAKIGFQPRRKIKNRQILRFGRGRRTKNAENWLSAMADGWKTVKTAFRPRPKCKKWEKQVFGRGRWTKNDKNWLSATAENLSSINFNAWQCVYCRNRSWMRWQSPEETWLWEHRILFFTEDSSKFAFSNLPTLKNPLKFSLFSFFFLYL